MDFKARIRCKLLLKFLFVLNVVSLILNHGYVNGLCQLT